MKSAKEWCDEMSQPRSGPLYEHGTEGMVEAIQRDALEAAAKACQKWITKGSDFHDDRPYEICVDEIGELIRALTRFRGGSTDE